MERSTKITERHSRKALLPPGSLVYTGEKRLESTTVTLIEYDEKSFVRKEITDIEQCFSSKDSAKTSWINVDGIHEADIVEKLGGYFGVHPLVLEDILNPCQRPKAEEDEKYLYAVLKIITFDDEEKAVKPAQLSIILTENYVVSFQEKTHQDFSNLRDRIEKSKGRIRKMGADYLMYSILDAVVDNYFVVLEKLAENIESFEDELVTNPTSEVLRQIHMIKNEIIFLRKNIWPLRELINTIQRSESKIIKKETRLYLRDVYDHTIQIIDTVESFRDMAASMFDIYLSSVSNKMNSVMKVLTIIATLFIPLTFVAGIYGMNFKYMPETEWRLGYPAALLLMAVITAVMLIYFRKKDWI